MNKSILTAKIYSNKSRLKRKDDLLANEIKLFYKYKTIVIPYVMTQDTFSNQKLQKSFSKELEIPIL